MYGSERSYYRHRVRVKDALIFIVKFKKQLDDLETQLKYIVTKRLPLNIDGLQISPIVSEGGAEYSEIEGVNVGFIELRDSLRNFMNSFPSGISFRGSLRGTRFERIK